LILDRFDAATENAHLDAHLASSKRLRLGYAWQALNSRENVRLFPWFASQFSPIPTLVSIFYKSLKSNGLRRDLMLQYALVLTLSANADNVNQICLASPKVVNRSWH
jgi:hypothetical protein